MASFCKQCSVDVFGEDFGDFAKLRSWLDIMLRRYPVVLCEDCGIIQVDRAGNCITHDKKPGHGATVTGITPCL